MQDNFLHYITYLLINMGFNMNSISKVALAFAVSFSISSVASAAIVTTGTLDYDNVTNVITDSASGATYLGWDMVDESTYQQTVDQTNGGAFDGWHIASQTEAYEFYRAATGDSRVDAVGDQYLVTEIAAFGEGVPFGQNGGGWTDLAWFLSDEYTEVGFIQMFAQDNEVTISDAAMTIVTSDRNSASGDPDYIGWLLVGDSAKTSIPVPEPSIIALFGLGLVGLGFARKRRQA
jgi:hypothetical protein